MRAIHFTKLILSLFFVLTGSVVFAYESYSASSFVLYIDFDGEKVNGSPVSEDPLLTTSDRNEITRITAEDFSPFRVNVTDDRSVYDATANDKRLMVIVTDSAVSGVPTNIGGITGTVGVYPAYVFSHNLSRKNIIIGRNISHEAGHSFGLAHDGTPQFSYWFGHGNYCSIMGSGCDFKGLMSQWSKGEYQDANNTQDDVQIMTNFFGGAKSDDHGNSPESATVLQVNGSQIATTEGIITSRTDLDYFKFETTGGTIDIHLSLSDYHPNLYAQIRILNSSKAQVFKSVNATTYALGALLSTSLSGGVYYIEIDGIGFGDPLTNGFSDYGSLGQYSISGTVNGLKNLTDQSPVISALSPSNGSVISMNPGDLLNITANITDDGAISSVQFSMDGNSVNHTASGNTYSLSISPQTEGFHTYQIIATDNAGNQTIKAIDFKIKSNCLLGKVTGITALNSSTYYSNNPPSNLFDEVFDYSKTWATHKSPYFVEFEVPAGKNIAKMILYNGNSTNSAATRVLIYNSAVNGSWGMAKTDVTASKKSELSIDLPNLTDNYFRVEFISSGSSFSLRELELYSTDCNNQTTNIAPTVSITSHVNNQIVSLTNLSAINLEALASDSDGTINSISWSVDDQTLNGASVNWTPSAFGTYTIKVTVTDNEGSTASQSISLTIEESVVNNSCSGVNSWDANQTYNVNLEQVSYNGGIYELKTWWSNNNNPETALTYWTYVGPCSIVTHTVEQLGDHVSIFPNPVVNSIGFKTNIQMKVKSITVRNAFGAVIYTERNIDLQQVKIGTEFWSSGLYTLNIVFHNQQLGKYKLIKN